MKKKVSLFVVFCMVLGLMVSGVAAEQATTLSISNEKGQTDENVMVYFTAPEELELSGYQLRINYDDTLLNATAAGNRVEVYDDMDEEWAVGGFMESNVDFDGYLEVVWANSEDGRPNAEDNSIFRVRFEVIGEEGTADISIDAEDGYNQINNEAGDISVTYESGSISIEEAPDEALEEAEAAVNDLFENGELADGIYQSDIDSAEALVKALDEDHPEYADLMAQVEQAQDLYNAWLADALEEAEEAVEALFDEDGNLAEGVDEDAIDEAKDLYVDKLPAGADKDELMEKIKEAYDLLPDDKKKVSDDIGTGKGSEMLPFLLIGGLLAVIGAVLVLPIRKLRKQ